ncbi:hypothetical protein B0H13DRAFT_2268330 [Mycena leptocephala]|nr:hypothetical protein B0H13DRAFT_2268330 [Mycena leptocephala]
MPGLKGNRKSAQDNDVLRRALLGQGRPFDTVLRGQDRELDVFADGHSAPYRWRTAVRIGDDGGGRKGKQGQTGVSFKRALTARKFAALLGMAGSKRTPEVLLSFSPMPYRLFLSSALFVCPSPSASAGQRRVAPQKRARCSSSGPISLRVSLSPTSGTHRTKQNRRIWTHKARNGKSTHRITNVPIPHIRQIPCLILSKEVQPSVNGMRRKGRTGGQAGRRAGEALAGVGYCVASEARYEVGKSNKIPTEHKPIPGGRSHKTLTDWDWLALEWAGPLDTTLWDLTTSGVHKCTGGVPCLPGPSSRNSEGKAVKRTVFRRSCTRDRRAETQERKQSREPLFVVPAHKTIERKLGRESSRENRSSSFLHIRPSSKNSEEKVVERTVLRRSCTRNPSSRNSEENHCRDKIDAAENRARQAKDEITDSDQIVYQKCRLMPTNEEGAKTHRVRPQNTIEGLQGREFYGGSVGPAEPADDAKKRRTSPSQSVLDSRCFVREEDRPFEALPSLVALGGSPKPGPQVGTLKPPTLTGEAERQGGERGIGVPDAGQILCCGDGRPMGHIARRRAGDDGGGKEWQCRPSPQQRICPASGTPIPRSPPRRLGGWGRGARDRGKSANEALDCRPEGPAWGRGGPRMVGPLRAPEGARM